MESGERFVATVVILIYAITENSVNFAKIVIVLLFVNMEFGKLPAKNVLSALI